MVTHDRTLTIAAVLMGLLLAAGCRADEGPDRRLELSGPTMGTTWRVTVVVEGGADAGLRAEIDRGIRDRLARINQLVSTWDPGSELSRFNRSTSLEPFPVAPETFEMFEWAVRLARDTGGAFDATVAPLVDAWGFGPAGPAAAPPDAATVARLREDVGVEHLALDPDGRWVRKRRPGVRCDFSGFAPGYAADRIAAFLAARGFGNVLVDVGGELVARGTNDEGLPWQVAIERPQEQGSIVARLVPLTDAAMATSGDYRNYREVDGERLAHIIDPATGRPIGHRLASVTVIDPLGVRADGLATALMALGPEEGMALAGRLDVAALLVVRSAGGTFEPRVSPRFAALVER